MNFSAVESYQAVATDVSATDDTLTVDLSDGRTIAAPLAWYPRLLHATSKERKAWRLIAGGEGIHWPELDEDISIAGMLAGRPSQESQSSFNKWLEQRTKRTRSSRRSKK